MRCWGVWAALRIPQFEEILPLICDWYESQNGPTHTTRVNRAFALANRGDFPRAAIAFEDALVGDPLDLYKSESVAIVEFLAAAVKHGRVRDCLDVLDKRGWKDVWRPIYEALKAAEAGTPEYLKKVAVEIREPAEFLLGEIAQDLVRK